MIIEESGNVDPHLHLELLAAVIHRAVLDALFHPKKYSDALPFLTKVANLQLGLQDEEGGQRMSEEQIRAKVKTVWRRRKGEAA